MAQPLPITDVGLRQAVGRALEHAGELLVLIRYTTMGGARDWFLVCSAAELEAALTRVAVRYDRSDAVELYGTGELPYRGRDDEWLRGKALDVLQTTDVVLACKRDGDPELQDVFETDEVEGVEEWFAESHLGERLVGPHPLLKHDDFYPDVSDVFLAYAARPDGTVKPGAY